jgi:ribonucleotide reductase beta subunit family protein with ferritin-like domain
MHTDFAVLLYSKLLKPLSKEKLYEIIDDAVNIEKSFINDSISCSMIGMNTTLMDQYIEFVADRLIAQMGYTKLYNSDNPFDFMQLISIENKTNFFEKRVGEYSLANVNVGGNVQKEEMAFDSVF